MLVRFAWRRKRDSNPRGLSPKRFSRPPRYDRFDIPPLGITVESIPIIAYFVNRIIEIVALKSVVVFGDVARDVFDHFAGDNKSRDRRNERKRARRRATARIHVVRVRRGFLFHRFFGGIHDFYVFESAFFALFSHHFCKGTNGRVVQIRNLKRGRIRFVARACLLYTSPSPRD